MIEHVRWTTGATCNRPPVLTGGQMVGAGPEFCAALSQLQQACCGFTRHFLPPAPPHHAPRSVGDNTAGNCTPEAHPHPQRSSITHLVDGVVCKHGAVHAQHLQRQRVCGGEGAQAHQGAGHGDLGALDELTHLGGGVQAAATQVHNLGRNSSSHRSHVRQSGAHVLARQHEVCIGQGHQSANHAASQPASYVSPPPKFHLRAVNPNPVPCSQSTLTGFFASLRAFTTAASWAGSGGGGSLNV